MHEEEKRLKKKKIRRKMSLRMLVEEKKKKNEVMFEWMPESSYARRYLVNDALITSKC